MNSRISHFETILQITSAFMLGTVLAFSPITAFAASLPTTQTQPLMTSYTPIRQAATAATGVIRYVSPTGSNDKAGSSTSPWRTVKYALTRLKPGDTLFIKEGTYKEAMGFSVSGTVDKPIKIEGLGNVTFDGASLGAYTPTFDTKGHDYLSFKNIKVINSRAGVQVSAGSHHITIDGLKSYENDFAVLMKDASYVTVKNGLAVNSRNAYRGEGNTHHITFEDIMTYGSKDIYDGYDKNYTNGDGFIFENQTHDLSFKDIKTYNHWDAGMDIKGDNVTIQNVVSYGNKNGLKLWGQNIRVTNALVYGNKRQAKPAGGYVDGFGVNIRPGAIVTMKRVTFVDNEAGEIQVSSPDYGVGAGKLTLADSVIARKVSLGQLLIQAGSFSQSNNVWYDTTASSGLGLWANPQFQDWTNRNYRLKTSSPAYTRHAGYAYTGIE